MKSFVLGVCGSYRPGLSPGQEAQRSLLDFGQGKNICSSHDFRVNYGGCYCHGEKMILRSRVQVTLTTGLPPTRGTLQFATDNLAVADLTQWLLTSHNGC